MRLWPLHLFARLKPHLLCAAAVAATAGGASLSDLRLRADAESWTRSDAGYALSMARELVEKHTPRNGGTKQGRAAAGWLCSKASIPGATALVDSFADATPDGQRFFCNAAAIIPANVKNANRKPWVIVLSHFDTTPNGGKGFQGANDGASTSGLLLALEKALLRNRPKNLNLLFLWTDGEEARYRYAPNDGFHGARHALENIQLLNLDVVAVIGLDMLGDRDLAIEIPANGDRRLKEIARAVAPDIVTLGHSAVRDDFSVFLDAGHPAIDLIDFEFGPDNAWWHTPQDTLDKISAESLFRAGDLAMALIRKLDSSAQGVRGAQPPVVRKSPEE